MRAREAMVAAALAVVATGASVLADRAEAKVGERAIARPVFEGAEIDGTTRAVVERSCGNCHSESVEWPWYSHVPPASWMIHRDVAQARERLNLSRWTAYTPAERQALLAEVGAAARSGSMPPGRYTALHRGSRLSGEERERLYRWTRAERRRLKAVE